MYTYSNKKEEMVVLKFENILEPRRQEISNFIWASRELHPKVPHKQLRKIGPGEMKLEVLNSPKIRSLIEKVCISNNINIKLQRNSCRNVLGVVF